MRRFECLRCLRSFSESTSEPECWQKKRFLNEPIRVLLCSGISQRRLSLIFGLSRETVVRKFLFLSQRAALEQVTWLEARKRAGLLFEELQFDEMETFEHTKCKPLSIPLLVEANTRRILGFRVAQMPAKGPLTQISLRKYGPREDHRSQAALSLFESFQGLLCAQARIDTDEKPAYPSWIKKFFPQARHRTFKGRRAAVVGQGELKKIGRDPLFSLNHTAAMFRANVNRLVRKTWCTTKRPDRLLAHLSLYAQFHNQTLLNSSPF